MEVSGSPSHRSSKGAVFSPSDSECVYKCESVRAHVCACVRVRTRMCACVPECVCARVSSWLPTTRKPGPSELEREQGGYSGEMRVPNRKHVDS